MICGNKDIAVQIPAAIPIISAFSSMNLDDLKIMPRLLAWKELAASLRSKMIKNINCEAYSSASSNKQKERSPRGVTWQSTCTQIQNGHDAEQGKAKNR